MRDVAFTIVRELPEAHREAVAGIYWDAFAAKLGPFLGPRERGVRLLAPSLRGERCVLAVGGGEPLGVAGLKHDGLAFVDLGWDAIEAEFGLVGAAWRAVGLTLFERGEEEDELLMDGIAVAATARGRGVGTALLRAVVERARELGRAQVRLDVVDTNPRARALYEREGFVATRTERVGVLGRPFGFRASTTLVRAV